MTQVAVTSGVRHMTQVAVTLRRVWDAEQPGITPFDVTKSP